MKAFSLNLLPSPSCALLLERLYFDTASRKIEATIEICELMAGSVLTVSDCALHLETYLLSVQIVDGLSALFSF